MASQRDVTKKAFQNAAAMVRDADLAVIFGDDGIGTEDQQDKAQRRVVEILERFGREPDTIR